MDNLEINFDKDTIFLKGHATKYAGITNKNLKLSDISNILDLCNKSNLDLSLQKLNIDLGEITKIDTVGLAVLMQWMRMINKDNLNLKFININEKVNYACRLYGVTNVFA